MTLNGLQPVCQALSYLESPSLFPFDPVTNGQNTPGCWGRGNKSNSSESNNCKGNEFQNPEEDTSLRPPYLGGMKKKKKKQASYPGHNSISFSSKCSERSSGEKSKVLSNKRSFQGCNVLAAPSPSSILHYHCLQASHPRTHQSAFLVFPTKKIKKLVDAAVTDTPVMLNQMCLAAYPWHFHCLLSFFAQLLDSDQGW